MSNQRGTSRAYALDRLHRDAPELAAKVEAGELSPNAAMVHAGFRAYTFTVRAASPDLVADCLIRQLPPDWLPKIAGRIAG